MEAEVPKRGLLVLRQALAVVLSDDGFAAHPFAPIVAVGHPAPLATEDDLSSARGFTRTNARTARTAPASGRGGFDRRDSPSAPSHSGTRNGAPESGHPDLTASSLQDAAEGRRLIALVELARGGDAEAFGQLYDHYHMGIYRFLYYRVGVVQLAEDLTAETFFRALRSISTFRWQGKDFGAWLTTIARNLASDHFRAGRIRLEITTEDMQVLDTTTDGPEGAVLDALTNEVLLRALGELPDEQRECLVLRFLRGLSLAETAEAMRRSTGAVKQLQLRGVRNLARSLPPEIR